MPSRLPFVKGRQAAHAFPRTVALSPESREFAGHRELRLGGSDLWPAAEMASRTLPPAPSPPRNCLRQSESWRRGGGETQGGGGLLPTASLKTSPRPRLDAMALPPHPAGEGAGGCDRY